MSIVNCPQAESTGIFQKFHQDRADSAHSEERHNSIRRIAILTSGGDAPGMNALIRGIARSALYAGLEVFGIKRGYNGLIKGEVIQLNSRDLSELIQRGGTFLMTARSDVFKEVEGQEKALAMADVFNFDCVFCLGGDGTWQGAAALAARGLHVMTLPATIDNDIGASEYSIGFDTAVNTAMAAIDKLRDTASSHERCSVVEVMGSSSGYLALQVGIASGAEIILLPEHPVDFYDDVVANILDARNRGKSHYIVVVAEGAGHAQELASKIQEATDIESRATSLGHLQRGGSPGVRDRYTASLMGVHAVRALLEGRYNRAIVERSGRIKDIDLNEALHLTKSLSEDQFREAEILAF